MYFILGEKKWGKQLQTIAKKKKKWQTIPTQTQYLKTWDTLSQVKMY